MNVLRAARLVLLVSIATFASSLALGSLAENYDVVDATYLAAILSAVGMVISSLVAVSAQLAVVFGRTWRKKVGG